jgi:signal transduction histidine kinase
VVNVVPLFPQLLSWRVLIITAVTAIAYFETAVISLSLLNIESASASPLWLPAGGAMAIVFLTQYIALPGIMLGELLLMQWSHTPSLVVLSAVLGVGLQAAVGSFLLQRSGFSPRLDRLRDVAALVLIAAMGATLINATLNTSVSVFTGTISWQMARHHWWMLWIGDGVGILEIMPLLLLLWSWLHQHGWRRVSAIARQHPQRILEFFACFSCLVTIGIAVFCCEETATIARYPLECLPFPFVMWASLRFNQWGAVLSSLVLASISLAGLLQGNGPFIVNPNNPSENALLLQTFIAAGTITSLVLAATVAERRQVEDKLRLALERERRIAAQKDQLCHQVQCLNASLEAQVAERTAELQARMLELKSFYEMRDMFVQAVSHDLRTSITGTLMVLNKIRHDYHDVSHTVMRCDLLERMTKASDRQLTLINALSEDQLDQETPLILQRYPLQFAALVQQTIASLSPLLADSQTSLINCVSEQLPLAIADADKISAVLAHLITNAVKHNPPGIQVTLKATVEGDRLHCAVIDNGGGIASEHQSGLFKLYIRSLQNPRRTGIGLGLYLCRQIVLAHGGEIGMHSAPSSGATFWFTLPLQPG